MKETTSNSLKFILMYDIACILSSHLKVGTCILLNLHSRFSPLDWEVFLPVCKQVLLMHDFFSSIKLVCMELCVWFVYNNQLLLSNTALQSTNNMRNEYKYHTIFVLVSFPQLCERLKTLTSQNFRETKTFDNESLIRHFSV